MESDFAAHGHRVAHRGGGEGRDERYRNGDACRGAILWNGPCRHMYMHITAAEETMGNPQGAGSRPNVTQRRLRRFLHDLAKLSGQGQLPGALHDRDFYM